MQFVKLHYQLLYRESTDAIVFISGVVMTEVHSLLLMHLATLFAWKHATSNGRHVTQDQGATVGVKIMFYQEKQLDLDELRHKTEQRIS